MDRNLRRIIERDLEIGDRLPTERDLAEMYGVSRITIRQALSGLEADGYLERRQGAGTFVSRRPEVVQQDFGLTTPWKERFTALGHVAVSSQVHVPTPEDVPYEIVRLLPADDQEIPVHHAKRVHSVDGRAIGLTDSWVSLTLVPQLPSTPLVDGSMSKTLAEVFDIEDVTWEHFLEVGVTGADDATILNTNVGAALIVVWSISRRPDGALCEASRTAWLGSRVRFHYASGPGVTTIV